MASIRAASHEKQYTYFMTSRSVFFRMGNISDKFTHEQNQLVAKYFRPLFVAIPPTCFGQIFFNHLQGVRCSTTPTQNYLMWLERLLFYTIMKIIKFRFWFKKLE